MARVVAHLGRPETPQETADRKAEASRRYRSSKTFRNLIAALLVTVAVVFVVVAGVPRGEPTPPPAPDIPALAAAIEADLGRPVLSPSLGDGWRVNQATTEGVGGTEAWTMVYVRSGESGFLRVAQGFDAGETWVGQVLDGTRSTETVDIDGITWNVYRPSNPAGTGNIDYALATPAGPDYVLVYGDAAPETAALAAASVTSQIEQLREVP
ncbi:amino acid transporter [Microbacterium sp. SUBG005]|nr:amino acid transporter [Microbacterium sp. SUBG005]